MAAVIIVWFGWAIFIFGKCKGELTVNYSPHYHAAENIPISFPLYLARCVFCCKNCPIIWEIVRLLTLVCLWMHQTFHISVFKLCERNTKDISSLSSAHICAKALYVLQPYDFVSMELLWVKELCYALKSWLADT